ncbi:MULTISPECIES: WecB/TagA/CpsF family glycosyltransferase [Burkholderia cepacia complex]|uniref:WecB/TagA/CpsF family glycosyltransferase n=1 Tax=Burkholderia cepacia complex TaxID=87882 RepID=UPI00196B5D11|nr:MULTISPECIES: WecB/TagA/CpsF family glycosyltransferase [Burkholderia cepacia complex]MBN3565572.1 WecB/TagA/CpsF family glycosyltransferase [Burkholderia cenocepacia]MBR8069503.1 WecB/TagA/CpsF family glycosyltransferase [Burkholderia cenocepacia]MBR8113265.1 WecB/TagA/CpsF family glycosyltransferase [Burkholderia cenocepacia]MBR8444571.1 WecB/TagA/CpsF family glycosyltransferase [Burkholderia cenocepacia]MDN7557087.1 WecB/TagA/CpsF family glycosyltransferase [Burkholderia orbicola]
MNQIELFGCPMDVATVSETVDAIRSRIAHRQFTQHVVVNVAKIVNMQTDRELAASVRACDIINIDGMGVVWGARVLGFPVPERVAGVDLFDSLLGMAQEEGWPIFMLGATNPVVQRASVVVAEKYPRLRIAGVHHGYFWDDERAIVERIRESGARLLFVAITSPRKENFINRWKADLGVDFVMGVGGTFDVVAGKVKRAPRWMQRSGLEWAYRVIQEPGRMWKRYLSTNSRFLVMLTGAYVSRMFQRKHSVNSR